MEQRDRLQTIKECDLIDAIKGLAGKAETFLGHVNLDEVIEDVDWLIDQAEKVESLQQRLDAKIVLINNGWEEERYALQDKVERYEKALYIISNESKVSEGSESADLVANCLIEVAKEALS
ncbi:hypothetical protein J1P26_17265 [Neobacillus sp. MM2021_6]|uniref:hypothetical protein n=1 Tax=Bacillaceae TaxID=186817 RepID=UPI00140E6CD6|nr:MULTISPECIES: hypothetical protein [Bacillaceae]MBO0961458.1 hypothetical protein [Neobacillus sp. MM2021_6]NHC19563.1 hypothetical protein [Bacillus sp. MM2020_4]